MSQLFTGFTLIDGTGAEPVENAALLLRDGRVVWAGPRAELPAEGGEAEAVDLTGHTVIPGLIDAHVHVCWNGRESVPDLVKRDRDALLLEAVETLRRIVASGTTSVRDIGGQDYMEMALRKAVEAGQILGPRMRTSGKIITMTGGHGHFAAREADGVDELRKAAREQIKAGADNIKLMATGGVATPGQDVQASQFTVEEMAAAVQAAHALGRTAAAHCHGAGGIKNSLLAGMDSIEHGSYLDEETAEMMVKHGAALVLTLGVANPNLDEIPSAARAEAERMQEPLETVRKRVRETVVLAREKGVFVGSGSDAGGNPLAPHDFSMAVELEELVAHGFSPLEALTIATGNNARVLRWEEELGTLEAGKWADFVVLAADPLVDISHVRHVEAVFKGGEKVA
ncbi:MAG: amidohydrolase family protein [Candidatus Promineifilaceae bacterium]|nr:amidohydrolase family protein [Candidatus Promineifilaceae bacterium]